MKTAQVFGVFFHIKGKIVTIKSVKILLWFVHTKWFAPDCPIRLQKKLGAAPIASKGLKPVQSDSREQIYLKIIWCEWSIRQRGEYRQIVMIKNTLENTEVSYVPVKIQVLIWIYFHKVA